VRIADLRWHGRSDVAVHDLVHFSLTDRHGGSIVQITQSPVGIAKFAQHFRGDHFDQPFCILLGRLALAPFE
jgi:hypothetical protein